MRKQITKNNFFRAVIILLLFSVFTLRTDAQVGNYVLTPSSGTFTPLVGGTVMTLSGGSSDDGYYNNIPIGFNFNYSGNTYNTAAGCTNGWLSLIGSMTQIEWTNNLSGGIIPARPVLAPLWDDHDGAGITFTYLSQATTTLGVPDSVFTAEWLDVDWQFQGGSTISFQVKLYKNSGNVQFIYRQEITPVSFTSASIGISGVGTGAGNFLSLNNSSASPATSATTETTSIATKPATGQIYTFSPPVPAAPIVFTGTKINITTSGVTLNASIAANTFPAITSSGIVVGTLPNPVIGGSGVIDSTTNPVITTGSFSKNIAGLSNSTTYFYRTYAINSIGTSYGVDSTFTTNASAVIPTVFKISATNVNTTTATFGGNITSNGGDPITASGVVYSTISNPVIGGLSVIDSTTNPLAAAGAYSFNAAGLAHSTKYYFSAYATNGIGTAYSVQDSFTTAPIISTLPYNQNFDIAGVTGWKTNAVTGTTIDWELGTPAKTYLNAAFSAPNAYVTRLTGNYVGSDCGLESPQFDFTLQTITPVLRFKQKFDTDADFDWDGGIVEISINGGLWTRLDATVGTGSDFNTPNSGKWYNNNSASGPVSSPKFSNLSSAYSSQVNGWITSVTPLTGAAGQSNVKIRFRFGADVFGTDEGWAIDDIEVVLPTAPTVITGTKSLITTSNATIAGNITSNGNAIITSSGVVYSTSPSPVIGGFGVIDSTTNPLVRTGLFNKNIVGLTNATTYFYRAYATNAVGTSYGADSSFTTLATSVVPTILKTPTSNLTATTVTLGGNITSNGGDPVTASGVVYSTISNPIIGGLGVIDSTTNPLAAAGLYSFNISGLTHSTKYYFRAYATNGIGTAYSNQDSFTTAPIISVIPYNENFDGAGNTGYTALAVTGTNNDWVVGTPAKTKLIGAFSGANAWVTKLTGSFTTNSNNAAVTSPQFDFTTQTADPILRFQHKFSLSSFSTAGYDVAVIEISINNGAWVKLDNNLGTGVNFNSANGSIAWYNGPNFGGTPTSGAIYTGQSSGYSSQSNGWIQTTTKLTGAAGQANVKFRMRFEANTFGGSDEGWAFDNIEIFPPTTPTVITGTKSNITTSVATLSGIITNNGNNTITASGVVFGTSPAPVIGGIGVTDSTTNPLVALGQFNKNIAGLTVATTYFYRAYATNALGTSYGADSIFTTLAVAVAPTVFKTLSTNVNTTTATIGGNITSDGGDPITASGVVYSTTFNPVIGGLGVVDSTTSPLKATGLYSFNIAGLTHSTKYYFRAYATNGVGTAYSIQDSFITAPIVSNLPYAENFDGATTLWTTAAINGGTNAWEKGSPTKAFLNAAFSAPNAFVTKLSGNYLGTEDCVIQSPQFDFSTLTNNPIIRFKHKFDESNDIGWDAGVVEISINNGAWTRLDNTTATLANSFNTLTSAAWYNSSSANGTLGANKFNNLSTAYPGHVNGWISSATILTGAAGQSNVKVRFRFWADGITDEGWAVDNIEIFDVVAPITAPSAVASTTNNGTTMNVSWTNGNGAGRIVVARLNSTTAIVPTDFKLYKPNENFGLGDSTGLGNYVVYNGTATSTLVIGLTNFTNYTFDVYEYNGSLMHVRFNTTAASSSGSTLPVKLVSFTANNFNGNVQLNWITANETNNKGFEIQRSVNGKTFKTIDFIKGAGNSNKQLVYTQNDLNAFANLGVQKLYYRLNQIDFDGKATFSIIKEVNINETLSSTIKAYPNPFNDNLNFEIQSNEVAETILTITDISGKIVNKTTIQLNKGLNLCSITNLEKLVGGIYFVKISNNATSEVIKIIKN